MLCKASYIFLPLQTHTRRGAPQGCNYTDLVADLDFTIKTESCSLSTSTKEKPLCVDFREALPWGMGCGGVEGAELWDLVHHPHAKSRGVEPKSVQGSFALHFICTESTLRKPPSIWFPDTNGKVPSSGSTGPLLS